jgi:DNA-directed RNA polymerase
MFIIDDFSIEILKNLKDIDKKIFLDLFCRENLKKTIMTYNYGASLATCWEYFKENIDTAKYTKDQIREMKEIFDKFYQYLNKENTILKYSPQKIVDYFMEKDKYIVNILKLNTEINLKYNSISTKQIELRHLSKRFTKKEYRITEKINYKKIKTSIRANYIHTLDASLVH